MENKPVITENKKKHPIKSWIWLVLAILYVISPLDFIPDTFPVLGWLDDFSILSAAGLNVMQQYHEGTHDNLAKILKYLKWTFIILALLLIVLLGIIGYWIFS